MRMLLLSLLLVGAPARAAFHSGEIATAGHLFGGCYFLAFPIHNLFAIHDRTGAAGQPKYPDANGPMAALGNEIVVGRKQTIEIVDANGNGVPFTATLPALSLSSRFLALTPATATAIYAVVDVSVGNTHGSELWLIERGRGDVQRTTLPSDYVDGADVSGCTFYYRNKDSGIGRFDLCASAPLLPLRNVAGYHVRVLPDGGFLTAWNETLRRYDRDGNLIRSFPLGDPMNQFFIAALTLDVDPRIAWVVAEQSYCGDAESLIALNIDNGDIIERRDLYSFYNLDITVAVAAGWYAATPSPAPPPRGALRPPRKTFRHAVC